MSGATADDPFHLERFRRAQDADGTYAAALAELRRGRKTTHWMWFVFPQIAGLGRSETAILYALRSMDEAHAYLADPVLGERLRESAEAVAAADVQDAQTLLGGIDAQKLHSSMTLFARADPSADVFRRVLDRFYDGQEDPATLERL